MGVWYVTVSGNIVSEHYTRAEAVAQAGAIRRRLRGANAPAAKYVKVEKD